MAHDPSLLFVSCTLQLLWCYYTSVSRSLDDGWPKSVYTGPTLFRLQVPVNKSAELVVCPRLVGLVKSSVKVVERGH